MKRNDLLLAAALIASAIPAETAEAKPAGDAELHAETLRDERRFAGVFPPGVKTVACISPASYPGSAAHRRGLDLLRKAGLNVKIMPHAFTPPEEGQYGAPLADRLADFYAAWNDPEVDMILCIRGGRGCRNCWQISTGPSSSRGRNFICRGTATSRSSPPRC